MSFLTALSIGSSLASGLLGSKSNKAAAKAAAAGNAEATARLDTARGNVTAMTRPWRHAGTDAVNYLRGLLLGEHDSRVGTPMDTAETRRAQAEYDAAQRALEDARGGGGARPNALGLTRREPEYTKVYSRLPGGRNVGDETSRSVPFRAGGDLSALEKRLSDARSALDAARSGAPKRAAMRADEELIKSPGYQFRLDEGNKAIERGQAAQGGRLSGRAIKEALRYGQDFASNEFGSHVARIFALSGQGQNAVGQQANTEIATAAPQYAAATGQANANAAMGSGASWNNAIQGGIGNYVTSQYLNSQLPAYARPGFTPIGKA